MVWLYEVTTSYVAKDLPVTCLQVTARGFAQYELFKSTDLDDIVTPSQTTVTLDLSWSPVEEILQTPPLSSTAALVGMDSVFSLGCSGS